MHILVEDNCLEQMATSMTNYHRSDKQKKGVYWSYVIVYTHVIHLAYIYGYILNDENYIYFAQQIRVEVSVIWFKVSFTNVIYY